MAQAGQVWTPTRAPSWEPARRVTHTNDDRVVFRFVGRTAAARQVSWSRWNRWVERYKARMAELSTGHCPPVKLIEEACQ